MKPQFYRCHACRFSTPLTETGVDEMRAHIRDAHRNDRTVKVRDVYVEVVKG